MDLCRSFASKDQVKAAAERLRIPTLVLAWTTTLDRLLRS